jgi:hypothetical protein
MLETLFAQKNALGANLAAEHVARLEDGRIVRESATVLAQELVSKLRALV